MSYRKNPHGSPFELPPPPASAFAYAEQEFRPHRRAGERVGLVAAVAVCLLFAAISAVGAVVASSGLVTQFGLDGNPALRMDIAACATVGAGKDSVTVCDGEAAPGSAKGPAGLWFIDNPEREYDIGSVVDVRCDSAAACTPLSARAKGRSMLGLGFALAVTTGALLGGFAVAANGRRWGVLRRRWLRRALAGWFSSVGLLIVVGWIAWATA